MKATIDKLRIFIGSGDRFREPTNALVCSIMQNCPTPELLDIRIMEAWSPHAINGIWSNWKGQPTNENYGKIKGNWVTPFSLFRYAIPSLCDHRGYALYLDSDMLVLTNVLEIGLYAKPGKWVTAKGDGTSGDCVTLMDCSAVKLPFEQVKEGKLGDKRQIRSKVKHVTEQGLPHVWNHCDHYEEGVSKLVHFTSMKTQPFKPYPEYITYAKHQDPRAVRLYEKWTKRSLST